MSSGASIELLASALVSSYGSAFLKNLGGKPIIQFDVDDEGFTKLNLKVVEVNFEFLRFCLSMAGPMPRSTAWARALCALDMDFQYNLSGGKTTSERARRDLKAACFIEASSLMFHNKHSTRHDLKAS